MKNTASLPPPGVGGQCACSGRWVVPRLRTCSPVAWIGGIPHREGWWVKALPLLSPDLLKTKFMVQRAGRVPPSVKLVTNVLRNSGSVKVKRAWSVLRQNFWYKQRE
ncbi:hypothetical protein chiPu_0019715 [Chiloscyllium punctatum]|uniref:Uncharacterized protein n=1 Tax=Chiloscyllium punctatum TaxID=137246 RepID=A0A401RSY8_CHIPU|nr:hypothetical protein [Chiloscyllium punctatum]